MDSGLSKKEKCFLIFVGENGKGDYGKGLLKIINEYQLQTKVHITGWTTLDEFRQYLCAADMAVQLRTMSRGETSGTVLDCLNYGIPTIVNANGAMSELPTDAVYMLPDDFSDEELSKALKELYYNKERRELLSKQALQEIKINHSPENCAYMYHQVIENTYRHSVQSTYELVKDIASIDNLNIGNADIARISNALSRNIINHKYYKRIFIDLSATCNDDLKTGIERVAKSLALALIENEPKGYRVEPIYLSNTGGVWHYHYARKFTLSLLKCQTNLLPDAIVDFQNGDVLITVDISGQMIIDAAKEGLFTDLRIHGVNLYAIIYDLLPLTTPEYFPPQAEKLFNTWLETIVEKMAAGVCISSSVANDLSSWLCKKDFNKLGSFKIFWNHLGADIAHSSPSTGFPENAKAICVKLEEAPTFLMVGTIEPRKGHLQTIEAFTKLWADGEPYNLVIVGKEGWKNVPVEDRRNIPQIISMIKAHPERDKHLFWMAGISDEYLEKLYEVSSCLIFASEGEGFGLPLIEAAQKNLPIIARDIPVFREVAGEYAYYFSGKTGDELAEAVKDWLALYQAGKHPKSDNMPWLTWKESAQQLLKAIGIEEIQ